MHILKKTCQLSSLLISCILADSVYPQTPYYKGRTITIVQGADAGGAVDVRVRVLIPFLEKHIPGNPTIINQYMAGAGGQKMAGYMYKIARPDGLTIGVAGSGFLSNAILNQSEALYDVDRFIYLGSADTGTQYVFLTRKAVGLNSMEKLLSFSGLRIGAQTIGQRPYVAGRLFAFLLGLKEPKFVTGYSGQEVDLALLRNEIDARSNPAGNIMIRTPEWVEKNLMDFHVSIEIPVGNKHPRFAKLPELESFTRNGKEKAVMTLFRNFTLTGSPYFFAPQTPQNLVQILRDAMRKTFNDPEFTRIYKTKTGDDATPIMPEVLQKVIRELPRSQEVIDLFKQLAGGDSLPVR